MNCQKGCPMTKFGLPLIVVTAIAIGAGYGTAKLIEAQSPTDPQQVKEVVFAGENATGEKQTASKEGGCCGTDAAPATVAKSGCCPTGDTKPMTAGDLLALAVGSTEGCCSSDKPKMPMMATAKEGCCGDSKAPMVATAAEGCCSSKKMPMMATAKEGCCSADKAETVAKAACGSGCAPMTVAAKSGCGGCSGKGDFNPIADADAYWSDTTPVTAAGGCSGGGCGSGGGCSGKDMVAAKKDCSGGCSGKVSDFIAEADAYWADETPVAAGKASCTIDKATLAATSGVSEKSGCCSEAGAPANAECKADCPMTAEVAEDVAPTTQPAKAAAIR